MDPDTAFLRSIKADLRNPTPILIYADWLEEQGREDLAYAWRWMGRRGYRPARRNVLGQRNPWAWWCRERDVMPSSTLDAGDDMDRAEHPEAWLPAPLFRLMRPSEPHIYCRSLAAAVNRLARGLQVLGELAGMERQPGDP